MTATDDSRRCSGGCGKAAPDTAALTCADCLARVVARMKIEAARRKIADWHEGGGR